MLERIEVGFDPTVYHVTEGGIAILRVVLNIAYMDQIVVSLQSNEGSATGNFQVIGYIICEVIHSRKSLSLVSLKRDHIVPKAIAKSLQRLGYSLWSYVILTRLSWIH